MFDEVWRLSSRACLGLEVVGDYHMVYVTVLGPSASRARLTIVLDKRADIRPCIIPSDEIQCLVLTIMTGDRVIVTVE